MLSATEGYAQRLFANASACIGVHVRVPDESSWRHTPGAPGPGERQPPLLQEGGLLEKLQRALRDPPRPVVKHRQRRPGRRRVTDTQEDASPETGAGASTAPGAPGSVETEGPSGDGGSLAVQVPAGADGPSPQYRRALADQQEGLGWSSPDVPIEGLRTSHGLFKCARVRPVPCQDPIRSILGPTCENCAHALRT